MNPPLAWKWIDLFTIFLSVWIILSVWLGTAGFLSPVLILVSMIITYAIRTQLNPITHAPDFRLPLLIWVILAVLLGFVLFGIQGSYDLSADIAPSMATKLITDHIPTTYAPFYELPFFYQLGLPTIASQLSATGVPEWIILWNFAVIGIGLLIFGLVRLAHILFSNPSVSFWIPIVFFGTRLPFYNTWFGEYPWMLSLGLGLMSLAIMERSWILGILVIGASALVHPYIAVLTFGMWLILRAHTLKQIIHVLAGIGIICIPVVVSQIIPYLTLPKTFLTTGAPLMFPNFLASVLLVGLVPFLLTLGWVANTIHTRTRLSRTEWALLVLGFGGIISSVLVNAFFPGIIFGTKLPTVALVGFVLLGAHFLSNHVKPKHVLGVILILLMASTLIMIQSNSIQEYIGGSKLSLDEAQFATRFGERFPGVFPVLFLSEGSGKMAYYAGKIAPDADDSHPMLAFELLLIPEAKQLHQQSMDYDALAKNPCDACIDSFLEKYPSNYIVINTNEYAPLTGKQIVWTHGSFIVYVGNA